ncbi:MAG: MFS transporter [Clostridiales bacterium]|nr:MFS transporter [Clostridiales bacterium]
MQYTYRHTRFAGFVSYIVQAIVNNLSPLLFLTFQRRFSITLSQISLIITINFAIQMAIDSLSAQFIDKLGYRVCMIAAHALAGLGLVCLGLLPEIIAPYPALLIATFFCAVGGGLLEVLVSPLIEALPSDHKEKEMSLLHSFYCWGHVGVVLLSTAYFALFGTENWRWLPIVWAIVPFANLLLFFKVPLCRLGEGTETMKGRALLTRPVFWLLFALMICAGASEQAVSQWASLFAESGLGVSKTLGDLLGPCTFAAMMGLSRIMFSKSRSLTIRQAILLSSVLCVACYLMIVFSPWPLLSLVGCGLCGFSVGVMWPGLYSTASSVLPAGGTAMFAYLALGGDIGCCAGPSLVGAVSDAVTSAGHSLLTRLLPGLELSQAGLKTGFLAAIVFPLLMLLGMWMLKAGRKNAEK